MKRVKFGVSGHFLGNAWREWPEIWYAAVSWPPSELIRLWLRSGDPINVCRAEEAARRHRAEITGSADGVNAISNYRQQKKNISRGKQAPPKEGGASAASAARDCRFCTKPHGPNDRCPAKESKCAGCCLIGHWAKSSVCKKKKKKSSMGCLIASISDLHAEGPCDCRRWGGQREIRRSCAWHWGRPHCVWVGYLGNA